VSPLSNTVSVVTPPGPTILTFTPTDDSTIRQDKPDNNYGALSSLQLDSPPRDLLVRFDLGGIDTSTVVSATLRLFNTNSSSEGGNYHVASDTDWDQATVTWNSAPAAGMLLGSLGSVSSNTWYEVDVTGAVLGDPDGVIGIRTANFGTTNGAYYASLENPGGNAPELVVELSEAPVPDTEAPSAPGVLSASGVSSSLVSLGWGAASDNVGVVGYDVFRDGVLLASVAGGVLSFDDATVVGDTGYDYWVVARDAAGNVSPLSNTVSVVTPPGPTILTFTPTDDSTIRQNSPDDNYGADVELEVDGVTSVKDFLMRYDISGIGSLTVTDVKLRLWVTNSSSFGGEVRLDSDTMWSEGTVTWNTAPLGDVGIVGTLAGVSSGTWVEIDLATSVTADGPLTLRVGNSPTSNGAGYASKEDPGGVGPQLIITAS
jgi:chitodextrinase